MKKTCMNCRWYHFTLADEDDFHIHAWCEQWQTVLHGYALADRWEYSSPYYDDLETGDAFCYMFEPKDKPAFPDEWFDRNKAENERNRIP